jgi:hypothetical protein
MPDTPMTLSHYALPSALLGTTCVLLLTVLGGLGYPDYSHVSQFISELGASGAPHEHLVRFAGFLPAGLLLCFFAWTAFKALPRSGPLTFGLLGLVVYAAGYIVAAFFPCDLGCRPATPSLSQIIHNIGGLVGYALAPLALGALALAAHKWPGGKHLSVLAIVAAVLVWGGVASLLPKSPLVGLSQRVIETAVLSWVVLCGLYIQRQRTAIK